MRRGPAGGAALQMAPQMAPQTAPQTAPQAGPGAARARRASGGDIWTKKKRGTGRPGGWR
jgi:hypothetical protein